MSYETPAIEMSKDNLIRVFHPRILTPSTYLTATVAATGTTLTVASNDGFADKDLVLLEGFNNPLAESLLSQCIETEKGFAKHGVPSGLQVTIDIPILTKWNSI